MVFDSKYLSSLGSFPSSSPLTIIDRGNSVFSLDSFLTVSGSPIDPFDYPRYQSISFEIHEILNTLISPVFCSSWISTCGFFNVHPELILLHDLIPEFFGSSDPLYLQSRMRWLEGATSILAVSSFTASQYLQKFPSKASVQWCHPPLSSINLIDISVSESSRIWNSLCLNFGSAKGYFFLPSAAGIGTYKNPEVVLQALCDPRLKHFDLIVSGSSDLLLRNQIRSFFPQLIHRVHFAGFTDYELAAVYSNVICVVIPSIVEGFGLPVIEAFSHRCLTIVSDSSALNEAAANCSLRFPAKSSKYLADLLVSLVDTDSFEWFQSKLLPRADLRLSCLSPDLFALSLLAQARSAAVLH